MLDRVRYCFPREFISFIPPHPSSSPPPLPPSLTSLFPLSYLSLPILHISLPPLRHVSARIPFTIPSIPSCLLPLPCHCCAKDWHCVNIGSWSPSSASTFLFGCDISTSRQHDIATRGILSSLAGVFQWKGLT